MGEKKTIINKKAKFEYAILEGVEAGMVLSGAEVKSLRLGRGSLNEAFVRLTNGEAFLVNANIPGYKYADLTEYEPTRSRKLLMSDGDRNALLYDRRIEWSSVGLMMNAVRGETTTSSMLSNLSRRTPTFHRRWLLMKISSCT